MLEGDVVDLPALVGEHLTSDDERCVEPRPSAVNFYNDLYVSYQQAVDKVAALYR